MGVNVTHVPYRGTGPAMQDIIGGRIDYICDVISTSLPLVRADSVKVLALLSPSRRPGMPPLSTAPEHGLQDLDVAGWEAVLLPQGHARSDRAPARAGDERDPRRAGGARTARGPRPQRAGAGAPHARVSRAAGAQRAREMGRAGQGKRRRRGAVSCRSAEAH